jgi:hypothetical protein
MEVKNFGSTNFADYRREVDRGARFVMYQYAVSILIYTYRVNSPVYFIRGGESGMRNALKYSAISLLAGWWGFPWGPVYTIQSVYNNVRGGIDVTDEVLEHKNYILNPRNQYF